MVARDDVALTRGNSEVIGRPLRFAGMACQRAAAARRLMPNRRAALQRRP